MICRLLVSLLDVDFFKRLLRHLLVCIFMILLEHLFLIFGKLPLSRSCGYNMICNFLNAFRKVDAGFLPLNVLFQFRSNVLLSFEIQERVMGLR